MRSLTYVEQIQYAFIILMVLAFGMIKLSITFYYRRIFVTGRGLLFDWITKVAISIVLVWTIGCLFAFIFSCGIHISAYWGSTQGYITYCGPSDYVSNAFVVSDLITDVMVLCLPLPVVSTQGAGVSSAEKIAKVVDLETPNDDWKENDNYWCFSDGRCVSCHLRDCKLTT